MLSGLLLLLGLVSSSYGLDIEKCNRALGMESGRIRDEQLSASSAFDPSTGPIHARLNTETGSGAWCPSVQINASSQEWIQLELPEENFITAVRTQGRWDKGRGLEYPEAFMLEYWRPSLGRWARYKDGQGNEIIPGNVDTQSAVFRQLDGGIVAKLVRLIPVSESIRTVCMRFELYECPYKEPLSSYSAPIAAVVDGLDLRDSSYDGTIGQVNDIPWLSGGFGRLFDGVTGEDNFEELPRGWVGWHISQHRDRIVPLEFFLSRRQNISAILLHTSNYGKRGARTFRSARIHFAPIGNEFSPRVYQFDLPVDSQFKNARWVHIPVPYRIASRLRVELQFGYAAEWLLISEIRIESEDAIGLPEDFLPNGNFSYLAENDVEENIFSMSGNCFLIILLFFIGCIMLTSFCFCFLAHIRRQKRPAHSKSHGICVANGAHSSSTSSTSYSPPMLSNSRSFLLHHLLQSAARRKGNCSQSSSLLKADSIEEGDRKELIDIARLVMHHNGTTVLRTEESEEESDEYADPDAPVSGFPVGIIRSPCQAAATTSARGTSCRPAQLQLHYATSNLLSRNFPLNGTFSSARIDSPCVTESVYRYRVTPTMTNFPGVAQLLTPPPLPQVPPPKRTDAE